MVGFPWLNNLFPDLQTSDMFVNMPGLYTFRIIILYRTLVKSA